MSRERMLNRIRAAVSAGAPSTPPGPVPRDYRPAGDHAPGSPEVLELLTDRLVDYHAQVRTVTRAELTDAVREVLAEARTVIPPELPADVLAGVEKPVHDRSLTPEELDDVDAVITGARVAIAVTGTIILDAGPDQGRRALTLVPDRHVVVLTADQVVETVPEALRRLDPVRPLTMVSGPSATSDIELSRVEGVHGPRTLQVLIVT